MTTKAALHELIDELPDDEERLQRLRAVIAQELKSWNAAREVAISCGWDLGEAHLPAGSILFDRRQREQADPVLAALMTASDDNQPLTDDVAAAIEKGKADIAAGRTISDEELGRRLGR